VPTTTRRDCAQLNLRMEPAERDRIRAAIPRGSLNPVVIQLIMDYVRVIEASAPRPQLPMEDSAA
jgi:hypothetical protein